MYRLLFNLWCTKRLRFRRLMLNYIASSSVVWLFLKTDVTGHTRGSFMPPSMLLDVVQWNYWKWCFKWPLQLSISCLAPLHSPLSILLSRHFYLVSIYKSSMYVLLFTLLKFNRSFYFPRYYHCNPRYHNYLSYFPHRHHKCVVFMGTTIIHEWFH